MARIPSSADLPPASQAGLRPRQIRAPAISSIGDDIAAIAGDVSALLDDAVVARRKSQLAKGKADAALEIKTFVNDLANEPGGTPQDSDDEAVDNFETFAPRYKRTVEDVMKRAKAKIDPQFHASFDAQMEPFVGANALAVRKTATRAMIDISKADLVDTIAIHADLAARATNEVERQSSIQSGLAAINDAKDGGIIDATDAGGRVRQFMSGIDFNRATRLIQDNPEAAERELLSGGFKHLDEKQTIALTARAQSATDRFRREQERREAAAVKLALQALESDVLGLVDRHDSFVAGFNALEGGVENGKFREGAGIADPDIKARWEAATPGERLDIKDKVLSMASKRRAMQRSLNAEADKAEKVKSENLKTVLYLTPEHDKRLEILSEIVSLNQETPETVRGLADFVEDRGGGFSPLPNPGLEREMLRGVEEGRFGPDDIRDQMGSLAEAEFTSIMARVRVLQNAEVRSQMAAINRTFGLPAVIQFPTAEQTALSAQIEPLKLQLQDWIDENPDASTGEIRAQRRDIIKSSRSDVVDGLKEAALERVTTRAAAVTGFDIDNADESLKAAIAAGSLAADDPRIMSLKAAIRNARKLGAMAPGKKP